MMPRQKNERAEKCRQINKENGNLAASISKSMDKAFVERRRQQGRIAQQNYRARKENTIASLEKRNDVLESVINDMVVAFLDFHDATQTALPRLNPTKLAQDLKEMTLKFIECSRIAANLCDTNAHDADKKKRIGGQKLHEVHNMSPSWDTSTAQPIPGSYESSYFDTPNIKSFVDHNTQLHYDLSSQSLMSYNLTPSFAHFLEYSINDHALMCLSSPETDVKEVLRIFKLCFSYHTVDQISIYLYRSLLGLADGDDVPLRHLGGAGLHYRPPQDMKYLSQSLKLPPTLSTLVQNAKERGIAPDLINGLAEFDGEWLDARDVEQYLYQKGIATNGKNLKVVTSLDKLMSPWPTLLNSAATSFQATPPPSHLTDGTSATLSHGLFDCQNHLPSRTTSLTQADTRPPYIPGYNQKSNTFYFSCNHFGFDSASSVNAAGLHASRRYLSPDGSSTSYSGDCNLQVFLNLEIMIERLKETAVCLVGCPGFRKKDIDSALKASIISISYHGRNISR